VRFPDRKAEVAVEAKVDGLSPLDGDPNYVDDVNPGGHTSGDYATDITKQHLHAFASAFYDAQKKHNQWLVQCGLKEWPIYPLWVIDVSLPFGGQYDFHGNWSAPHQTHGRGDGVDFAVTNRIESEKAAEQNKNKTAEAWPSYTHNLPGCGGYKIPVQAWLTAEMNGVGLNYGSWDTWDFNQDPQLWHLRVPQ
jgi:hypothetical protein